LTAIETDGLYVITGPLTYAGGEVRGLVAGEVVRSQLPLDAFGGVWVSGQESRVFDWIDLSSLTPLSEIQNDPDVQWGDLLDPNYVHDYVWVGDDE
jgi:hypothetical protein